MKQYTLPSLVRRLPLTLLLIAAIALPGIRAFGQVPNRIPASFSSADEVPLKGSLHPLARAEYDKGRVSGSTKVPSMTLAFAPSAAQKTALTTLLAAQQNPASPQYHQWLTPARYAAQFGMSPQDIATAEAWLQKQGFTVLDVTNGRDAIEFSGTAAQVEAAFHTEVHQYQVNGTMHRANSTVLTLPAPLAASVAGVRGIAQFPPHAMHTTLRQSQAGKLTPQYTSSVSQAHFLVPSDIATIYDIKALYNAGYTGTNQNIAIVGRSAISTSDIDAFRSASGLPAKEPTLTLVPNTGTAATNMDDETESDLDVEWSGAIAQNANILFYYAGNTGGIFDALSYVIDQDAAPVVSISYGVCELEASSDPSILEPIFMKASSQGQTIIASSGDQGATGCDSGLDSTGTVAVAAMQGLSVNYPASSPFVTAMGGTEFSDGTGTGATNYWNGSNDTGGGSAISYIPETAWNETTASEAETPTPGGFASTGGGASILFTKPSWQVATGVPTDGARDVPDISLDAAAGHDSFLYCSTAADSTSCSSGFRDASSDLTAAGGTSFDAPIFAGILTLINQKNSATGAGNINPSLYTLYGTAASAFHDITAGDNEQPCQTGTADCPAGTTQIGYMAGVGYDETTGLGTIDAFNLANVFPAAATATTEPLLITTTTLSASTLGPAAGTSVTFTAAVASAASNAAPSGTVQFAVNGSNVGSPVTVTPLAGSTTGTAIYTTSFAAVGTETVTAIFSGNTTEAQSTSSALTITVGTTTAPAPSFTLAATNVTVTSGATATSTLTVTSSNGYAGTVDFGYTSSAGFTGCLFGNPSQAATLNAGVTTTVTVDTLVSDCVTSGAKHLIAKTPTLKAAASPSGGKQAPWQRGGEYPIAAAALLAGLAMIGRKRTSWPIAMVLMLSALGTLGALSGCGGGSSSSTTTSNSVPAGTYTITLTGTDSTTSSITATTTFTVTVQ